MRIKRKITLDQVGLLPIKKTAFSGISITALVLILSACGGGGDSEGTGNTGNLNNIQPGVWGQMVWGRDTWQ